MSFWVEFVTTFLVCFVAGWRVASLERRIKALQDRAAINALAREALADMVAVEQAVAAHPDVKGCKWFDTPSNRRGRWRLESDLGKDEYTVKFCDNRRIQVVPLELDPMFNRDVVWK